jgi:flavin reductase (DIM6/NTAB) family NADH-FMN oxidoreductase RutF
VTIHSSHPFAAPEPERDPLRRFRGRMVAPVSVWVAKDGERTAGWTLSSFLVADGRPAEVIGILDEESELADLLGTMQTLTVNLLSWSHRGLADAFAGIGPAPGGAFKLGAWHDTDWGPVLDDGPGWLGARVATDPAHAGWGLLIRATIEHVEIGPDPADGLLASVRGRYQSVASRL